MAYIKNKGIMVLGIIGRYFLGRLVSGFFVGMEFAGAECWLKVRKLEVFSNHFGNEDSSL